MWFQPIVLQGSRFSLKHASGAGQAAGVKTWLFYRRLPTGPAHAIAMRFGMSGQLLRHCAAIVPGRLHPRWALGCRPAWPGRTICGNILPLPRKPPRVGDHTAGWAPNFESLHLPGRDLQWDFGDFWKGPMNHQGILEPRTPPEARFVHWLPMRMSYPNSWVVATRWRPVQHPRLRPSPTPVKGADQRFSVDSGIRHRPGHRSAWMAPAPTSNRSATSHYALGHRRAESGRRQPAET